MAITPNKMGSSRGWALLAGVVFVATGSSHAQKASHWRIFKASDGLVESFSTSVTVSSRGNVWVSHGDADAISMLDGYQVMTIPSPGRANFRVFETPAGQVWSVFAEGLQEYRNGGWARYEVPEIRAEFATNILRQVRPFSLVPLEQDRVLFLLSDSLREFNASTRRTTVLRRAGETKLGKFLEMVPARDGGLWISGWKGLAKIPGPLRSAKPGTVWEEHPLDHDPISNLQRPLEDDRGGVTCVADSAIHPKRVIVLFDGENYSITPVAGETPRQAFRGAGDTFWVNSGSSVFLLEGRTKTRVEREEISAAQFFDMAGEAGGAFWLATSEGLLRYVPASWQIPPETPPHDTVFHAALEDRDDTLWLAHSKGLLALRGNQWFEYGLPDDLERFFQATDGLFNLPDGTLVMGAGERLLGFDPRSETFHYFSHPSAPRIKPLGVLNNGKLCVAVWNSRESAGAFSLETYDGARFETVDFPQPEVNLGDEIFFLFTAQNGDLWLGGSGGVAVLHEDKWQTFGPSDGSAPETAVSIAETGNGTIWCGTRDKIWEFDGKKWAVVKGGFDRVNSLRRSRDGSVWVGSNSGLHRVHKGLWNSNGIEDGLPSAAVYKVYEDKKGRIWAGTTRGLSRYNPDADRDPPRTYIQRVRGEKNNFSDGAITIAFMGRDKWKYTAPDRLLFSYRLDEQEWSPYAEDQTVAFNDLAAGKHHFQARAMDRNWNVDPSPAVFEFTVVLPWYKEARLVFISIAGLAITLFFAGLAFNRHRQLVRSHAEVEKIVALRTRQLEKANQELLHSQKMTALGTLAAGVAHDFNNILSIIKGSAQIIEGNVHDSEKVRTRVNRIKMVVEQGAGIVKAMLGFSRPSEKEISICDVNAVVAETLKLLGDQFLRDVEIRFDRCEDLPHVPGSKELIQQILLNLVFNASDALGGKGQIIIMTGELTQLPSSAVLAPAAAGRFVFVGVKDFGCGIAPEVLPRIFEPFFTTKSLSTRRGTGLGLSRVYELSHQMGYGLIVDSEPGKGSTFTLLMPAGDPGLPRT